MLPALKGPTPGILLAVLVVFASVAAIGVGRAGYSIDEEYTLFGVRGIAAHGVPVLPSGALYDRGLPFTYAAWLSGALFGHGFPAYRLPGLISAIAAIIFAFRLAAIARPTPTLALVATATVAALPWMIFSAEWARFYGMFIAVVLASVLLFVRACRTGRGLAWWLLSIWFAHLLHEFAILLVLLPAVVWILKEGKQAIAFPFATTGLALGAFVLSELAVVLLHLAIDAPSFRTVQGYIALHLLPIGWESRFDPSAGVGAFPPIDLWARVGASTLPVLAGVAAGALVARAAGVSPVIGAVQGAFAALGQFARMWLAGAIWLVGRPSAAIRTVVWTIALVAVASLIATGRALGQGATLSWPLASGMLFFALGEVTASISGLILEYPASTALAGAALFLASVRHRSRGAACVRLLLLWVMLWLLAFDVLRVELKPRYYAPLWPLVVITLITAIRLLPASSFARRRGTLAARAAIAIVVAALLVGEQYRSADENRASRCVAGHVLCVPEMLAYDTSMVGAIRGQIRDDDIVICGDDLLCVMELGRADYWLYSGTVFRHRSASGDVSLYGGTPIVASLQDLQAMLGRAPARRAWIVVPALRKYPTWTANDVATAIQGPRPGIVQVTATPGAVIVGPI